VGPGRARDGVAIRFAVAKFAVICCHARLL
jgi:hypothetical protein